VDLSSAEPEGIRILRAGRIRTMARPGEPATAEALAVAGDRVVATGRLADLRDQFGRRPEIDLGDGCVVPGFVDAHLHLTMAARQAAGVDLSPDVVADEPALAEALLGAAAVTTAGEWVMASRYDHMRTTSGRVLDRAALDRIVREHPVLLVHIGAHWGVANSKALELAGLTDDTPDPSGGLLGRDGDGRLNGVLHEQALFDLAYPSLAQRGRIVPEPGLRSLLLGLDTASDAFLSAGITSVGDAMVGPDELRLLQQARSRGRLRLRVNALITHPHLDHLVAAGITDGFGDDWLRIGGIKAFVDGAVAGRTCWVSEPFEGTHDHGIAVVEPDQLHELVRKVHAAGLRVAVHANGDKAIELLLDAVHSAQRAFPEVGTRHRIEHCSVVTDQIVARIAELKMIPVPFAGYVYFHGDSLEGWYGSDRLERMFAHGQMLAAGIPVAGSSDYPCGPYEPLIGVQSCVTRRSRSGRVLGPSQRIDVEQAMRLFGTGAAFAAGEQSVKGRLAPGFLADLAVLDRDPFEVPPDEIGAIGVRQTWVGGRPAWDTNQPRHAAASAPTHD
jgi:predicted amidohydrolase YtcJ